MTKEFMSKVLMATGRNVADCLSFFGVNPRKYAFAILIWPSGDPDHVSSMAGGNHGVMSELSAAFAAAAEKAKKPPSAIETHRPPDEGHA